MKATDRTFILAVIILMIAICFRSNAQEGQPSAEVYILKSDLQWYTIPEPQKIQCKADRKDCFAWWNVDSEMCCLPCVNPAHEYVSKECPHDEFEITSYEPLLERCKKCRKSTIGIQASEQTKGNLGYGLMFEKDYTPSEYGMWVWDSDTTKPQRPFTLITGKEDLGGQGGDLGDSWYSGSGGESRTVQMSGDLNWFQLPANSDRVVSKWVIDSVHNAGNDKCIHSWVEKDIRSGMYASPYISCAVYHGATGCPDKWGHVMRICRHCLRKEETHEERTVERVVVVDEYEELNNQIKQ